jgi:ABC-type multidrug transport system ATPase subunit
MSRIARIAQRGGMTVVAAVHQPSTEVFELFHGLCLMANGRTVYFGPSAKAIEVRLRN